MYTPTHPSTSALMKEVFTLVVTKGKMIPQKTWSYIGPNTEHSIGSSKSQSKHRRFGKAYFKRNKRKVALFGGGLVTAGVMSGGIAMLIGIPIAAAGYGIKRSIIAGIRKSRYKFVKNTLNNMAEKTENAFKELLANENTPDDALKKLMYWFRHKHGQNISVLVDQVKDVRRAYDVCKGAFEAANGNIETCDDAVGAVEKMMLYLAVLNSIEDMLNLFCGCYLYVDEQVRAMNEEFDQNIGQALQRIYIITHDRQTGFHKLRCSNQCCYKAYKAVGKGNYKKSKHIPIRLLRCLQDAAHSKLVWGHGGHDRSAWIKEVLGLPDFLGTQGDVNWETIKGENVGYEVGGEIKGMLEGMTETTFGLPLDTYSGNIIGNLAGKGIDAWRLNETFVKQFEKNVDNFTKNATNVTKGLYEGLIGGTAGVFQTVGAAVVEASNSFLNKYQLKHKKPLKKGETSLKHTQGRTRLDVLRANLKGSGILEGWVDEFLKVREYQSQFLALKNRNVHNCLDAYNLARAALARQHHLINFLSAHVYVTEFYEGVAGKIARMTMRWAIMTDSIVKQVDRFMNQHANSGACERSESVFCYFADGKRNVKSYFKEIGAGSNDFNQTWLDLTVAIDTSVFKNPEKWDELI